ncbi:MAG: retroviral-like aspartic protease family protein [Planctomycetia bacterium]|nr:retroviral-like aspartic protease family protein [Planctomycetia bacterium]MBL6914890.1 retroviral-like aspartic protease family protein [Planctomycetota bacterium]
MRPQCRSCDSFNDVEALHCYQCGSTLADVGGGPGNQSSRSKKWLPWLLPSGIALWIFSEFKFEPQGPGPEDRITPESKRPGSENKRLFRNPEIDPDPSDVALVDRALELSSPQDLRLVWGWLESIDPAEIRLDVSAVAVTDQGWVLIPRKSLLGSDTVTFRKGRAGESSIAGGIFRIGDPVGLWQMTPPPEGSSLQLMAYDPQLPLTVLRPGSPAEDWFIETSLQAVGSFLFSAGEVVSGGGALVQEGALVGWLIPQEEPDSQRNSQSIQGAWFWNGASGEELISQASLGDFQRAEFIGGVVEGYRSIFDDQLDDLEALSVLESARLRTPRLKDSDIPDPYLRNPLIQKVRERLSRGLGVNPSGYFWSLTSDSMMWLEDGVSTALWLTLALESQEVESMRVAIQTGGWLLDRWSGDDWSRCEKLIPQLWISVIELLRKQGDLTGVDRWIREARPQFPENESIRLLDAERLLELGQLSECEAALSIPVSRTDLRAVRESLLERLRIERSIEGRILVRFTPGSPVIEAVANIGGLPVQFLVDTGASATSIPMSVAEQLGFVIDSRTPRRRIRTASDEFLAPVVNLPQVNLEGATVSGIQATILDLPGQPGVGLLGLDFLGRFRLDIDVERGWLLLEPR